MENHFNDQNQFASEVHQLVTQWNKETTNPVIQAALSIVGMAGAALRHPSSEPLIKLYLMVSEFMLSTPEGQDLINSGVVEVRYDEVNGDKSLPL